MKVNVLNYKNIYTALTPINYISFIFGLRPFTRNNYGNYSYSFFTLLLTVAYVSGFYGFLNFHGVYNIKAFLDYQSDIVNVMQKIHYFGNIFAMACGYILCQFHYRKEINVMKKLEEIDEDLRNNKLIKKIEDKNHFLYKLQIYFIFLVYIIFFALSNYLLNYLMYDTEEVMYMTQAAIAAMINCTVKLKFHFYTVALRSRVEIINAYLNEKIANLTGPSTNTAFYKMEKDMECMLKIHKKVTDASRTVNGIYGFQELFSFVLYFVLLLSDGYIVLYSLTIGGNIDFLSVMAVSLKIVVFYLIELLIDLRACMLLCAKVNHTKNILFKIKIEPENEEARNIVMVAVFKLMHDKLVLTACDLFSMDFSFLFSMFASVTTYLLILLQFDIDAARHRIAAFKANLTCTQCDL